jgi:hypothetical protein
MQFQQFDVASAASAIPAPPPQGPEAIPALLNQILDVQREHLAQAKAVAAAQDHSARWKALVARWQEEYPELPAVCKQILPILEKAYGGLLAALAEELRQTGSDALDNDFALQDFLDRFGMRLGQLGNILNVVTPLAEMANQPKEGS